MGIVRNIVGVLVGMAVGMAVNMALIQLNMAFFPLPEGADPNDLEALGAHMATLPATAFLLPLLAHSGQAFVGGGVAAFLGASRPVVLALIVGGFTALGSVMVMAMMGGPIWMWIDPLLNLAAGYGAGALVASRREG